MVPGSPAAADTQIQQGDLLEQVRAEVFEQAPINTQGRRAGASRARIIRRSALCGRRRAQRRQTLRPVTPPPTRALAGGQAQCVPIPDEASGRDAARPVGHPRCAHLSTPSFARAALCAHPHCVTARRRPSTATAAQRGSPVRCVASLSFMVWLQRLSCWFQADSQSRQMLGPWHGRGRYWCLLVLVQQPPVLGQVPCTKPRPRTTPPRLADG